MPEKLIILNLGSELISSSLYYNSTSWDAPVRSNMNIKAEIYIYNDTDTYWEAYSRRCNYWIYDETVGQKLITQGTLWYYPPSGVNKISVNYTVRDLPRGNYRMYLQAPEKNSRASGRFSFYF